MAQKIVSVDAGSPAFHAGIRAGDELLRIGGETIVDLLDYEALCAESRVRLLARRAGVETTRYLRVSKRKNTSRWG